MGQGTSVMQLKTIGHGWGGHSQDPNPYLIMVIVVLRSKASESCCRSGKSDSGECIKLASMTLGNMEYLYVLPSQRGSNVRWSDQ
jgi:hypothetical protein